MKHKNKKVWAIFSALTLAATLAVTTVGAEPTTRDVSSLLEKKYDVLDPDADPQVARVHRVFKRVQGVADKRGNRVPQLSVLNRQGVPWAVALPDGNILLSIGAVNLCYRNVTPSEGDGRVAFVIGHELAHLAKNDFWDIDAYLAIADDGAVDAKRPSSMADKTSEADQRHRQAVVWNKETEADDLGFLYAGISGYAVQALFSRANNPQSNFFFQWTEQVKGDASLFNLHPPPEEREAFLRSRLGRLAEEVALFHFGLRLAHFGDCERAIFFFRNFLQVFPSREVYNNLGACYLRRAQQLQAVAVADSYWLPILLDVATRAEQLLVRRGTAQSRDNSQRILPVLPDKAGHELEQAMDYLERSAAADAGYLPARLNLATAHYYRGEMLKARGALEEALVIAPKDQDVAGWHALLLYLDSQESGLGDAALPRMTRMASHADAPSSLLFNHAILVKKSSKKAKPWWKRLQSRIPQLPGQYAQIVCVAAGAPCPPLQTTMGKPFPWSLPVQLGIDLDTMDRNKLFAGWQTNSLGFPQDKQQGILYRQGEETEVLELDGYVVMVVLRDRRLGTSQELKKKLGSPMTVRQMAGGDVWGYGSDWAVLVREGYVKEAWVIAQQ